MTARARLERLERLAPPPVDGGEGCPACPPSVPFWTEGQPAPACPACGRAIPVDGPTVDLAEAVDLLGEMYRGALPSRGWGRP